MVKGPEYFPAISYLVYAAVTNVRQSRLFFVYKQCSNRCPHPPEAWIVLLHSQQSGVCRGNRLYERTFIVIFYVVLTCGLGHIIPYDPYSFRRCYGSARHASHTITHNNKETAACLCDVARVLVLVTSANTTDDVVQKQRIIYSVCLYLVCHGFFKLQLV